MDVFLFAYLVIGFGAIAVLVSILLECRENGRPRF